MFKVHIRIIDHYIYRNWIKNFLKYWNISLKMYQKQKQNNFFFGGGTTKRTNKQKQK